MIGDDRCSSLIFKFNLNLLHLKRTHERALAAQVSARMASHHVPYDEFDVMGLLDTFQRPIFDSSFSSGELDYIPLDELFDLDGTWPWLVPDHADIAITASPSRSTTTITFSH